MNLEEELFELVRRNASIIYEDANITLETNLVDEFGYDSITLMQLLIEIEEKMDVTFEEDAIRVLFGRVGDILLYLEKRKNEKNA